MQQAGGMDVNDFVRVMGFAAAPLALGVLMFIPAVDFAIALTVVALFFGTSVIATQSATDAPAGKVLAANAGGFLVWAIVLSLFAGRDNTYAPGIFVFDTAKEILKALADAANAFGSFG